MVVFGGAPVDVTNSVFTNIGREGVLYFGAGSNGTFSGNSYTGKGIGDWLDYAVEAGAGAHVTVSGNTVIDNLGVATSDGSTSAAFLVTTFYGPGTQATFGSNTVTNSTAGVSAGFDATDTSGLTFLSGNHFTSGVGTGVDIVGDVTATGRTLVDGNFHWLGGAAANTIVGADGNDTLSGDGGVELDQR